MNLAFRIAAYLAVFASYLILLFPLLSFLVGGLVIGPRSWRGAAWLAVGLLSLSMIFSIAVGWNYYQFVLDAHAKVPPAFIPWEMEWLRFSSLDNGLVFSKFTSIVKGIDC